MYFFKDYKIFTSISSTEILNAEHFSAGYCLFLSWGFLTFFFFFLFLFFFLFKVFDSLKYRKPYLDEENQEFRHDLPKISGQ